MTYNKTDTLTAVAQASGAVVVDLGLGIDEAARITGVEFELFMASKLIADVVASGAVAYSFDPEDTVPSSDDDEQFAGCMCAASAILASTGGHKQSEVVFLDFSGMNLVTTRNLAFVLTSAYATWTCRGRVYYERFKPSKDDLVQLIATRR